MKKLMYLLLICGMLFSCSEKEDKTSSYIGPGSEYSIEFNETAGTFDLTESTASLTVSGSYTTLSSGFKKLTVGAVSGGSGSGPSVGDEAYGVDIPGVVFLLKPMEEDSEIIAMVSKGSCPTADFNMNWIITSIDRDQKLSNDCSDATEKGTDSLGTFSYTSSTETGALPKLFDVCGDTVATDQSLGKITCSAGIGTPETEGTAKMYLTANGGSIVKITDDNQVIVALPVNTVVEADIAGEYIGLVMVNGAGAGGTSSVYPVKSTAGSDGVFSFDEINPSTGEVITTNSVNGDATMVEHNVPDTGFSKGTFTLDSPPPGFTAKKTICMSNQNISGTGKNFIFCVGQDPFDEENMINVLLISK